jgi:transglutaminase-like putative cysteine protease
MSGRVVSPRSTWGWVAAACAVSLGTAGALAASGTGHNGYGGAALGVVAALLAVLALPSLPTRTTAAVILALGGVVVVRHVRRPGAGLMLVGLWALSTLVALVLIDRADLDDRPRLSRGSAVPVLGREVVGATAILAVLVLLVGALLAPALGHRPAPRIGSGDLPRYVSNGDGGTALEPTGSLDTTQRPHLGDDVVMTVTASRPEFWRGQTFDHWNGSAWTQTIQRADPGPLPTFGNVATVLRPQGVPPTSGGRLLSQTFHIEATYDRILFAAAEPVQVESPRVPIERADQTLFTADPLGSGSSYRVVSRVPDATAATLRAADSQPVPSSIADVYAQSPIATHRVRLLAERVTRGAPTTYDKVRALESWMGAHLEYSLNAPVARQNVDVVDDFLFNVRQGWCEQISSSLVVMLRVLGVPAREATGFVPGESSRLTDEWVVRARDAHAWAEVYFPGVGWQAFDPTAHVALAGDAKGSESLWSWIGHHLGQLGLLVLLVGLELGSYAARRRLAAARRVRRSRSWAARLLEQLDRLGAGAGRARAASETATAYARVIAVVLQDATVPGVGAAIDADAYSQDGIGASARSEAEATLAAAAARAGSRRGRARLPRSAPSPA